MGSGSELEMVDGNLPFVKNSFIRTGVAQLKLISIIKKN